MSSERDQKENSVSGASDAARVEEIAVENRKIRRLRILVDFTMALIAQSDIPLEEAQALAAAVKKQAMLMFPDKSDTYDLIYGSKFRRLITQKYGLH